MQQEPKHATIVMQILHKLVTPSTISGDAKAIHSVVLSLVAQNATKSLVFIKAKDNSNQNINTLLNAFKPHQPYERSSYSSIGELNSWKASAGGTLERAFRYTLQNLFTWSSNVPPSYSHKLFLSFIRIVGAQRALAIIIEELKIQTSEANAIALDIATAVVAAPSRENGPVSVIPETSDDSQLSMAQERMNLRDALRLEARNTSELYSSDPLAAETIARLNSRVEAQFAVNSTNEILQAPMDAMMQPMDISTEDPAVAAAAAAAATTESIPQTMNISNISIDLDVTHTANDFELGHSSEILGNTDGDIFASITLDSSL